MCASVGCGAQVRVQLGDEEGMSSEMYHTHASYTTVTLHRGDAVFCSSCKPDVDEACVAETQIESVGIGAYIFPVVLLACVLGPVVTCVFAFFFHAASCEAIDGQHAGKLICFLAILSLGLAAFLVVGMGVLSPQ
jgi:hypothetical protein